MNPAARSRSTVSLLVVDDDEVTHEVLGLMLARRFPENTIHFAYGGEQGLELFKRHRPAIVITDFQMPVMDGITMAAAIKNIKSDTKFIILTAYGSSYSREKFAGIGGHDFLAKPIEFDKLFAAIEACISETMKVTAES